MKDPATTPTVQAQPATFPLELQQELANAILGLFLKSSTLYPHDIGGEYLKDQANAMFRELVYQHEEANKEDGDGGGCGLLTQNVNYTLGAFAQFISLFTEFVDAIGSFTTIAHCLRVDPTRGGILKTQWSKDPLMPKIAPYDPDEPAAQIGVTWSQGIAAHDRQA